MTRQYVILLVEDEASVRNFAQELLAGAGFTVLTASDAYEAIRVLAERHVDLLFTEIVMPGADGFDLAAQAKLIRPNLKVLYCTGFAEKARGRFGPRYGKLLEKPIRADVLTAEVRNALAA
ncbi:MAG TPA: response regulator [Stellaceae bacterium]|nr:response regulator [Stellaceae bacterium]